MRSYPGKLMLCVFLGLGGGAGGLPAAGTPPASVVAVQVKGTVEVQHGQASEVEKVTDGTQLGQDDTVTTSTQSSVILVLPSGSMVALREKSRLKIAVALHSPLGGEAVAAQEAPGAEAHETGVSQTSFELAFGQMLTRVRKLNPSSTFEVQTPVSVAAVRGTEFEVSYQPDKSGEAQYQLSTASGLVHVTPHSGKMVEVPADEQVEVRAEVGQHGVKIKHVKSGKLDRKKKEKMQKEGQDNERKAGEFIQKLQQNGAGPKAKAAAAKAAQARDDASRVAKPVTPATPNIPAKVPVPAVKRPPRRPGT